MKNNGEIPSYKNGKMPSVLLYAIIIAITVAAIAVTIFLGKKNHRETIRLATEQFNQQQLILARSAAKGIEAFILDVDDDLLALSNFPVVQKMETGILDRMEVLYEGIPPQTSSRRLDKNGILRFIYPNEGWRKDLIGGDYSQETWFQKAKKTGEVVISGLIINEAGERRIRVVRPVYVEDEKGTREFNGVIKCSSNPETMANLYVSPIVSGDTGYAWLLNEQGIFLAHHEEAFMGRDAFKVRAETNPELSYNTVNNIQQQMMVGEEGAGRYVSGWHRGEKGVIEKLIAYTPVHVFGKLWSVAVCAPVDEVERITSKAYGNELYSKGFIILILTAAGVFSFIVIYRRARILEKEIETRKQAQERIVHLNAVLQAIRSVNQLITKVKDRERLLQGACDNLIKTLGYDSAWIALIERDGGFTTAAQAGAGNGFTAMVDGLKRGGLTHCMHQAVDQSGVLVVADPAVECGDCPLVGIYAGKARLIARLEHEGRIYGFITVTVSGGMAVDEEERSLFEEVAGDIAFALHNMELEKEHKMADEALKEAQRYTRGLIEASLDALVTISAEGKITDVNQATELITGMSRKEIIGTDFSKYFTDPDAANRGYQKVFRDNYVRDYPLEIKHHDGKVTPVLYNASVYKDTQGRVAGVFAAARDMTEQKKAEEELRQMALFAELNPAPVLRFDNRGGILSANSAAVAILGEEAKRDVPLVSFLPSMADIDLGQCVRNGLTIVHEASVGQQYFQFVIRGVPKFGIGHIYGSDITKRKHVEEQTKQLQKYFHLQIERMPIGLIVWDTEFRVTSWNPSAEKIFGFTAQEALGEHSYGLIVPKEAQPHVDDIWRRLLEGDTTAHSINDNMTKDGRTIICQWSNTPLKETDGTMRGVLSMVKDITEQKNLEAQLYQSQKMEAIGVLAGGVAHDFNNLLTVIIGNAQLALMDVIKDESLREGIEEIKKAGERAASLTRQLLAFSRKQVIKPEVLDLNEEINETKKMFKRLIGEDIEFQTVLEPELWKIYADPGQINQVIMNMVVNARDAMYACADTAAGRPQGGKLTIETANTDLDGNYFRKHGIEGEKPGHYVMLAVSDTGSGMDKETREHIFEPFFTTKEVGKGTGLGLSTVYGIVKQNNGFVWVYSEPGKGTTFKVYLSKVKGDAEPEEKEQTTVAELGGSETVLIVEDDDSLRNFAQKALRQHGYKVLVAENGENALKVGKEHEGSIDLMITDVVMPKMGGKEAADRLQPLYPQMKVIYMSGYTDNAIVRHGVLKPGLNFLEKPFTPEGLARKVREALENEN